MKCCNTCPFLQINEGKDNPEGWTPDPAKGQFDWYTEENLNRLWHNGLKHGEPMICHSTDPNAVTYGGKALEPGKEKICLGSFLTQYTHLKVYEEELSKTPKASVDSVYKRYAKKMGKSAMTLAGIYEVVNLMIFRQTGIFGGLEIPTKHDENRPLRTV